MAGSSVADILNPRPAVYTRDHVAENRTKMKELESAAVARRVAAEMATERAVAAAAPSGAKGKFSHVESKLAKAGLGRAGVSPSKSEVAPGGGSPGESSVGSAGLGLGMMERGGKTMNFLRKALPPAADASDAIVAPFKRESRVGTVAKAAVPKLAQARPAVSLHV